MKDARERAEALRTSLYCYMPSGEHWVHEDQEKITQALEDAYRAGMLRAAEIAEVECYPDWDLSGVKRVSVYVGMKILAEAGKGERG